MTPYYEHGGITIYHGDCREIEPTGVSLVLTDPPYGINEKTERRTRIGGPGLHVGGVKGASWRPVVNDNRSFDPSWLLAYPQIVLWGANHFAPALPASPSWLVWDKRAGTTPDDNADCEMAWSNLGGPARIWSHLWRGVCRASEAGRTPLHPTQKPIALMLWCLALAKLKPGALVFDPYMGSGPVVVACKLLNYRAVAVEIEERYCEIAAKRLSQDVLPLEVGA